ncbi:conserved hypothetical protein [Parafrankia sp. Ea1.12]|nr:conserved hypothetical protein [Parafrankia sp. Ea1.12]
MNLMDQFDSSMTRASTAAGMDSEPQRSDVSFDLVDALRTVLAEAIAATGAGTARSDLDQATPFLRRFCHRVDRYRTKLKVLGWLQAGMMEDLSAITHMNPPREAATGTFDELAPEDVAIEVGASATSVARDMTYARTITDRLPRALTTLKNGAIDLSRLRSLERAVRPLDDELAAAVERRVLEGGPRPTQGAFADACRRTVQRIDPDGSAERARSRRAARRVWVRPGEEGSSTLSALLPAEEADACYRRVDQVTREIVAARDTHDERTTDQIRADVVVDLLTGRAEHGRPFSCDVQVVVPVTTLLGISSEPGEIPGVGTIPGAVAREMAARPGSTWRRLLTDQRGVLLDVSDRRHPTPAQVRHVRARPHLPHARVRPARGPLRARPHRPRRRGRPDSTGQSGPSVSTTSPHAPPQWLADQPAT